MKKRKKIILGCVLGLFALLALLLALPFLIDLNRFKPQIQEAVAKQVNAKLDFSSASLTILSGLGVELKDVSIVNTDPQFQGTSLLKVQDVRFRADLWPLLKGELIGNLVIKSPTIVVEKEGEKSNITALMKPAQARNAPVAEEKKAQSTPQDSKKSDASKKSMMDSLLIEQFLIENAHLIVKDRVEKANSMEVKDLDVRLTNIGFDKDVHASIKTNLQVAQNGIQVKGPLELKLVANTHMNAGKWESTNVHGTLNLDDMGLRFKDDFVKAAGVPLHFEFRGLVDNKQIKLDELRLTLQDSEALMKLTKQFAGMHVRFSFESKSLNLNHLLALRNTPRATPAAPTPPAVVNSKVPPAAQPHHAQAAPLLTPEQKKQFADADIEARIRIGEVLYEGSNIKGLELDLNLKGLVARVAKLDLNAFGGSLRSDFTTNLGKEPLPLQGKVDLQNIEFEQLTKWAIPDKPTPLEGKCSVNLAFDAQGADKDSVLRTLNAKGKAQFSTSRLNTPNVLSIAMENLQKFLGQSLIPGIKLDAAMLKKYTGDKLAPRDLKGMTRDIVIKDGKLRVDEKIASDVADGNITADVALVDQSLTGTGVVLLKDSVVQSLLNESKYFSYLLDEKGKLQLDLVLSGSVTLPLVTINEKALRDRLLKNSAKQVKQKIEEEIEKRPEIKKIKEDAEKFLKDKGINFNPFGN